jgi:hypothetical protein
VPSLVKFLTLDYAAARTNLACVGWVHEQYASTGTLSAFRHRTAGTGPSPQHLTEAYYETNDADGNQYITQYFQRARFEYHPEQGDPQYKVLLGLVGDEIYQLKQSGGGVPTHTPAAPTNTPTPTNTPLPHAPATTQVYAQNNIPAGGTGSTSVSCPAGSIVVGGGWASNTSLQVYNSTKAGNGWQVYASNSSGSSQLLNSYAVCLSGTSGSVTEEHTQISLPAGTSNAVTKACSSGVVTGGGFADDTGEFLYNTSPDGNGWQAAATNNSASSQLLNTYAIWLNGVNATGQLVVQQVSVAAGAIGSATATCPSGSLATAKVASWGSTSAATR